MPLDTIKIPENIKIIFFDMDHTLINIDCDLSWKIFLKDKKIVGLMDEFQGHWHYWMYRLNRLNQQRFFDFQLKQFKDKTKQQMDGLFQEHFEKLIKPAVYPGVIKYLSNLKRSNIMRVILTATNEDIAKPLASFLKMDHLIGTKLELKNGKYTGQIQPPWCGGENKIMAIQDFIQKRKISMKDTSYWGDNISDIVILEKVGFPVACNPSSALKKAAKINKWITLDLGCSM